MIYYDNEKIGQNVFFLCFEMVNVALAVKAVRKANNDFFYFHR